MSLDLAELQARFGAALRSHAATEAVLPALAGDPARNARRVGLYRGNVMAHATSALGVAYPVTRQMLGAEFFDALAPHFWRAYPARAGDWALWGAALAAFAATFEPTAGFGWLPGLARLEWAVHEAQYAPNATPAQLARAADDPFALPGTRVLAEQAAVASIWLAHQPGRAADLSQIDPAQPEGALVMRQGLQVQVFPLPFDQASVLVEHLSGDPT